MLAEDAARRTYAFNSSLAREAVLGTAPYGFRRDVHAAVAEVLEALAMTRWFLTGAEAQRGLGQMMGEGIDVWTGSGSSEQGHHHQVVPAATVAYHWDCSCKGMVWQPTQCFGMRASMGGEGREMTKNKRGGNEVRGAMRKVGRRADDCWGQDFGGMWRFLYACLKIVALESKQAKKQPGGQGTLRLISSVCCICAGRGLSSSGNERHQVVGACCRSSSAANGT